MKLHNSMSAGDVAEYGNGVSNLGEFKIRASAKAFNILSSGLYANKIRAIVREIGCNAVDSHAAAGRPNVPFDVHLPSILEPYFYIRDYGTGLSHEDVTKIYTTYFESTKTDSNDYIGALGLGSKSPFSYTDNFTVTAIKNGRKGIYSAFINESGFPSIMLMGENQTDEPSGVEVRFSVNNEREFPKFRDESVDVYSWFKTKPNILNCESLVFTPIKYVMQDFIPGVHVLPQPQLISFALMGNIRYPIEPSPFKDHYAALLKNGLVMEFGIGELDFQASREGLSYIPATIDAIKAKLDDLHANMQRVFDADVASVDATDTIAVWDHVLKYHNNPLMARIVDNYCTRFSEYGENLSGITYDAHPHHKLKNFPYCWSTSRYDTSNIMWMYLFDVELEKFNLKIGAGFNIYINKVYRRDRRPAGRSYKDNVRLLREKPLTYGMKIDKNSEIIEYAYFSKKISGSRPNFSTIRHDHLTDFMSFAITPVVENMNFIVHESESQIPMNRIRNHVKELFVNQKLYINDPNITPFLIVFESVDKSKPTDIDGFLKSMRIPSNTVVWKTNALLRAPSKPRKKRSAEVEVYSLEVNRNSKLNNGYRFYNDSRISLDKIDPKQEKLYVRLNGLAAVDFHALGKESYTLVIYNFITAFKVNLSTLGIYGFNKTALNKIHDKSDWVCLRKEIVNRILGVSESEEQNFEKFLVQNKGEYSCLSPILAYNRSGKSKNKLSKTSPILAFEKYVSGDSSELARGGSRGRLDALHSLVKEFQEEIGEQQTFLDRIDKKMAEMKTIFSRYAMLKYLSNGYYADSMGISDIEHTIKYINTVDNEV